MFTDRYGNELQATTGSKQITLGTDKVTLSWYRQGNIVTYSLEGTLSSSSGSRYAFSDFLPFNHPRVSSVISSFVAQTDLRIYGDILVDGKEIVLHLPPYSAALSIRSTLTVVVAD